VLQPTVAILLGMRDGLVDARAGRPPYLYSLLFYQRRRELLWSGFDTVVNLMLMGILLDSIAQWLILGASYPGAALVVGPVLITIPYCAGARVGKPRSAAVQVVHDECLNHMRRRSGQKLNPPELQFEPCQPVLEPRRNASLRL
jgi:hypothetical protein